MWVMTFHSACARMLRADAHRLGYTRQFTIYDAADSRRLIKKVLDDLDIDAKRFTPRAMQAQISDAKNKLRSAEDYRQLVGSYFEQTVADVYEQYERELHRANAMDFDDLLVPRGQRARALPGGPRPLRRRLPLDPRRRVPGHQPRPVPLAAAAELASTATSRWSATTTSASSRARRSRWRDGSKKPIEDVRGGRRGALLLRQRRLPPGARDADVHRRRARRGSRSRRRRPRVVSTPSTRTSPATARG